MRLWIDDVRSAPEGWVWAKNVDEAINKVYMAAKNNCLEEISFDHDSGDQPRAHFLGRDFIVVLNQMELWQEEGQYDFGDTIFHIHSMNPIGRENMRRIIQRNGWKEV